MYAYVVDMHYRVHIRNTSSQGDNQGDGYEDAPQGDIRT